MSRPLIATFLLSLALVCAAVAHHARTDAHARPRVPLELASGDIVAIDSALAGDAHMEAAIKVWRDSLQTVMGERLCHCPVAMTAERPESALTRFMADLLLDGVMFEAERYDEPVPDFALVNIGGIRTSLNEGEVTLGDIYAIAPFDNEATVVELDSAGVDALMQHVAERGGEALSRGVTIDMRRDKGRWVASDIRVQGWPLVDGRTYRVATIDYVADGGDDFSCLIDRPRRVYGIILHDLIANALHRLDASGRQAKAPTDQRIRF